MPYQVHILNSPSSHSKHLPSDIVYLSFKQLVHDGSTIRFTFLFTFCFRKCALIIWIKCFCLIGDVAHVASTRISRILRWFQTGTPIPRFGDERCIHSIPLTIRSIWTMNANKSIGRNFAPRKLLQIVAASIQPGAVLYTMWYTILSMFSNVLKHVDHIIAFYQ